MSFSPRPLSRLRPHGERPLPSLEKAEVAVEMSVLGEDAATCFRRIESLAIGSVGMHNKDAVELLRVHQVSLEAKVLAVGTAKAVQRAFRRPVLDVS